MRRLLLSLALVLAALAAALGGIWALLPDPSPLLTKNPRTTAVIEQRHREARSAHRSLRVHQSWVVMARISPRLVEAVIASEDASFFAHGPFDWREMRAATADSLRTGQTLRGASTLTQQLAKNLWLGTERTTWRKVKEAVLALKLERAIPKRRILTLYLNVAEWGDGVFGAEAAARAHFGVAAADLSTAQAVLLAAMLPAPRRTDLNRPSRWLARRSRRILDRMLEGGRLAASEHAHASAALERALAGASGEEEPPEED